MTESEKIINVVESMSRAMGEGNLEKVLLAYEKNACLVASPELHVTGEEFKMAMNGYVQISPKFTMLEHEVVQAGDIALHIAPWSMEAKDPSSGDKILQEGLSVAVFRRNQDGNWLMVIDNPFGDHLLTRKD